MTYKQLMSLIAKLYDSTTGDYERTVIGLELAEMMKRGKLRTRTICSCEYRHIDCQPRKEAWIEIELERARYGH